MIDLQSSGCVVKGVATLSCIIPILSNLVGALLAFAGSVAVFFIIFSGIKLITSGGEAKQVEGARHTLTYAVVGLIVILMSFFIINIISYVTNVPCIKLFGFNNCGQNAVSNTQLSPTHVNEK